MESMHSITHLVSNLGSTDEATAHQAVHEIMCRFPMTALPERWIDNSIYNEPVQTVVPEWLIRSGAGWNIHNAFINCCADQAISMDNNQQELFFTRMAALLGATRLFTAVLRERGYPELATRFVLRLTHTRMRQFPMQVCFSPTLRCQLECPYCISAGTADDDVAEPDIDKVNTLFDWLVGQGIKRLGLSGGEPTLSPLFPYIAEKTAEKDISLYMASNGMFSDTLCDLILTRKVASITLHLTQETINDPEKEKVYCRNARKLVEAGINVALRCNLTEQGSAPTIFAEYARKTGIQEIRVAVPTPNAQHGNEYIDPDALQDFAEQLASLHTTCEEYGINLNLAKPFPLCLLPETTARYFLGNASAAINCPMHQNDYSNNIVIHPDFSFIPCLGLSMKQHTPITEFTNLLQATKTFSEQILPLIKKPFFQHCPECPLWKGSRCIGACLSYRLTETEGVQE